MNRWYHRGYALFAPVVAAVALGYAVAAGLRPTGLSATQWWYLALLASLVPMARQYPVHLSRHAVLTISTPQFLLMLALLPLPDAVLAGTLSWILAELSQARRSGMTAWDIASLAGTICLSILAAGAVYLTVTHHVVPGSLTQAAALAPAGAAFFVTNVAGAALWATCSEEGQPGLLMFRFARDSAVHEAGQVGLAISGVLLIGLSPAALLLLPAFAVPVYLLLKRDLETQAATLGMLIAMADLVDGRDRSTEQHSRRVADHVGAMARALGMGQAELDLVVTAARVHDIGKVHIPDHVLFKPGTLTPEEECLMRSHVLRGVELLRGYRDFRRGIAMVRHHHERWDGKGYPDGRAGISIPEGARMIAIADSYDAMVSDRPYRPGMRPAAAIALLQAGRDQQWEGRLVDIFIISLRPAPRVGGRPVLVQALPRTDVVTRLS